MRRTDAVEIERTWLIVSSARTKTNVTFLNYSWAVEVFGSRTDADETRGQLSQNRKPFQQANYKRQRLFVAGRSTGNDSAMNKNLHSLDQARRPFAARLHLSQIVHRNRTIPQFLRE